MPCSAFLKTKASKTLHAQVPSVMVVIIHLLGKSFIILMDTTMLKDEKGNHLALLSNFLNSKQSSGLNESNYLYLLLSDLLLFRRNQGKRLFYFIVCHQMVIYHFDLIALILQKTASQDFFFFF